MHNEIGNVMKMEWGWISRVHECCCITRARKQI